MPASDRPAKLSVYVVMVGGHMLDAVGRVCREVLADAGEIAWAWEDQVMPKPDWAQMTTDERMNGVVGVIIGIIEAGVCRVNDRQAHQTLLFAAVAHGAVRRASGLTVANIGEEFAALRQVLVPYLEKKYGEEARRFPPDIDYAIAEAEDGSKYGHENPSSSTSWDEYVERLAQQSLGETRERIAQRNQ